MVRVIVQDTAQVRILMPRFQRFLAANQMAVTAAAKLGVTEQQLELTVNARYYGQALCAEKLARGFFAQALVMVKNELAPAVR